MDFKSKLGRSGRLIVTIGLSPNVEMDSSIAFRVSFVNCQLLATISSSRRLAVPPSELAPTISPGAMSGLLPRELMNCNNGNTPGRRTDCALTINSLSETYAGISSEVVVPGPDIRPLRRVALLPCPWALPTAEGFPPLENCCTNSLSGLSL